VVQILLIFRAGFLIFLIFKSVGLHEKNNNRLCFLEKGRNYDENERIAKYNLGQRVML
jgi:hypothetical protein